MKSYEFVSRVFAIIAQDINRDNSADLLIDLPQAVELLESGNEVHVFARKTGSDLWQRFVAGLKDSLNMGDDETPNTADVYAYANRTLGYLIEFILYPNYKVEMKFNDTKNDTSYSRYRITPRGLECIHKDSVFDKFDENSKCEVLFYRSKLESIAKRISDFAHTECNTLN